jgi:Tfp pilus assembly pilus retraction ATPase PilT
MYALDDLLHLVHSDGAESLRLHIGQPPIVFMDGMAHPLEGPVITAEDTERFLQSVANTRQRRELWQQGGVQFIYRFRRVADFVVMIRLTEGQVGIDIC